jgi:hypothetical protein
LIFHLQLDKMVLGAIGPILGGLLGGISQIKMGLLGGLGGILGGGLGMGHLGRGGYAGGLGRYGAYGGGLGYGMGGILPFALKDGSTTVDPDLDENDAFLEALLSVETTSSVSPSQTSSASHLTFGSSRVKFATLVVASLFMLS